MKMRSPFPFSGACLPSQSCGGRILELAHNSLELWYHLVELEESWQPRLVQAPWTSTVLLNSRRFSGINTSSFAFMTTTKGFKWLSFNHSISFPEDSVYKPPILAVATWTFSLMFLMPSICLAVVTVTLCHHLIPSALLSRVRDSCFDFKKFSQRKCR